MRERLRREFLRSGRPNRCYDQCVCFVNVPSRGAELWWRSVSSVGEGTVSVLARSTSARSLRRRGTPSTSSSQVGSRQFPESATTTTTAPQGLSPGSPNAHRRHRCRGLVPCIWRPSRCQENGRDSVLVLRHASGRSALRPSASVGYCSALPAGRTGRAPHGHWGCAADP